MRENNPKEVEIQVQLECFLFNAQTHWYTFFRSKRGKNFWKKIEKHQLSSNIKSWVASPTVFSNDNWKTQFKNHHFYSVHV